MIKQFDVESSHTKHTFLRYFFYENVCAPAMLQYEFQHVVTAGRFAYTAMV